MSNSSETFIYLNKKRKRYGQSFLTETPFLKIYENILSPSQSLDLRNQGNFANGLIIPYIGDVDISDGTKLEENETQALTTNTIITNPYKEDTILFYTIWLGDKNFSDLPAKQTVPPSDNTFHKLSNQILLGQFANNHEGILKTSDTNKNTHIYIINGIAEINERLLEKGDALLIKNDLGFEYETFSPNCMLLVLVS